MKHKYESRDLEPIYDPLQYETGVSFALVDPDGAIHRLKFYFYRIPYTVVNHKAN